MNTEVLLVEPRGHAERKLSRLHASRLRGDAEVQAALTRRRTPSLWVTPSGRALDLLLANLPRRPAPSDLRLLTLNRPRSEVEGLLHAHFRFLVSAQNRSRLLPIEELAEVLGLPKRADLFIGGEVLTDRAELLLYRGDLEPITVPLNWFAPRSGSPAIDVARFSVTDYGQTVCLGEYEASTDAILYEFDEQYRSRAKKRMLDQDPSLGGALRRLRLQKGLRQSDFPGVTAKEIARIEKGLVKKPHPETLRKIAKKARVPVEQLHTF